MRYCITYYNKKQRLYSMNKAVVFLSKKLMAGMQLAQKSKLAGLRSISANTTRFYWATAYKALFRL